MYNDDNEFDINADEFLMTLSFLFTLVVKTIPTSSTLLPYFYAALKYYGN